jgi:RimJ/RimL family protein N-acetyltransferase
MLRRLAAAAIASGAAVPAVDDAPDPRVRRMTIDMAFSHRLRTPRLLLVPAAETDVSALARHWADRQVRRFLWDGHPVGVGTVREVVAGSERTFARAGYGIWTVRRPPHGRLVGSCGLRETAEGEVELLYSLDPDLWGRGLATEAARAVLDHARRIDRLVAYTDAGNVASERVVARLGMTRCQTGGTPGVTRWHTTTVATHLGPTHEP